MKNKKYERFILISSVFILIFSLVIVFSFNFTSDGRTTNTNGGWQLQTNLQTLLFNGRIIKDMTFIDSVTGFAVTNAIASPDTAFILMTTNAGNNWFVNFRSAEQYSTAYEKIIFVTDSIGYACGGGGIAFLCKTTNRGNNWTKTNYSWATIFTGMSILGKDTIYAVDDDGLVGGVFRSFNGGQNWQQIYNASQYNPRDIYMINATTGFYQQGNLWKTTDGGFSWTLHDSLGFRYMKFFDTFTGYRVTNSNAYIQKTTDLGNNWQTFYVPNVPGISISGYIEKLCFIGKDTFWAAGKTIWYPNPGRNRGILFKTTNGGFNWGYQIPDTGYSVPLFSFVNFFGNKYGWAYWAGNAYIAGGKGIHTTVGGDSTIYVGINQNTGIIPNDFILEQNYPNPFNSITIIKYDIRHTPYPLSRGDKISLKIFDIRGKEIETLVDKRQSPGEYEIRFGAGNLSSGIYFYSLFINGVRVDTKKMLLIK